MQRARLRGLWWFVAGGVILAVLLVAAFQTFRGSTLARQDMAAHLSFPATYHGFEEASELAGFTLNDDGTAEVSALMLGTEERELDDGRVCLDGDVTPVVGKASWRTDDAGRVVIETGDRQTRLSQDDPMLMGWGWGWGNVLTPCTEEYTATFVTPNADYSD
ncbi:hypothetical protein [Microbacterium sp. PAMC22086]|uniref:hypothetical protein n=1 Tax=Microbacterium sp. PAMC22086 TaxID=2861281 RepID=UPI001C625EAE|nr:hypothetical protein [Microbacterium sp. PAMC22086]QYG12273.1 hypothetical protein KY497_02980 [Microbacterium sp. PAMC22086]